MAGILDCSAPAAPICLYPPASIDVSAGLNPVDTGNRPVFHTEAYVGSGRQKIQQAGADAAAVGGAVIIDRVYEVENQVNLYSGVLYTGGGIRRACTPHAVVTQSAMASDSCISVSDVSGFGSRRGVQLVTDNTFDGVLGRFRVETIDSDTNRLCSNAPIGFAVPVGADVIYTYNLARLSDMYSGGLVVDSVLFDGAARCNGYTHDWRQNSTLPMRGKNTIRNSVFYDTPSENLTTCGGTVENNIAFDLDGSFIHKSCSEPNEPVDIVRNNYVSNANRAGNDATWHAEGLITFSANAGNIMLSGNVFKDGREGVFGQVSTDDENVFAAHGCYANFPHLIEFYGNVDLSKFVFTDVKMFDVGPVIGP